MTCENCAHNDVCDGYQLATDISPEIDWLSRNDCEKCDDFLNNSKIVGVKCENCAYLKLKQSSGQLSEAVSYICENPFGLKGEVSTTDWCSRGKKEEIQDDL